MESIEDSLITSLNLVIIMLFLGSLTNINVSQIVTRNMIASIGWEIITDEGFLNNPYDFWFHLSPRKTDHC